MQKELKDFLYSIILFPISVFITSFVVWKIYCWHSVNIYFNAPFITYSQAVSMWILFVTFKMYVGKTRKSKKGVWYIFFEGLAKNGLLLLIAFVFKLILGI